MHIAIDFARRPEEAQELWTTETVRAYLSEAVRVTGLTRLGPEVVEENDAVLMGFQMIAESHISVHADRATGQGWADIFSCKDINVGEGVFVVDQTFGGCQTIQRIPRVGLE